MVKGKKIFDLSESLTKIKIFLSFCFG